MKKKKDVRFRRKVNEVAKLLNRTVEYHGNLKKNIRFEERRIRDLGREGMYIVKADLLLSKVNKSFEKAKGLDDYKHVNEKLQIVQKETQAIEKKKNHFLTTVLETTRNVEEYSSIGLDMRGVLELLGQGRNKMKNREYQAAILMANQAWNMSEEIFQRYDKIREHMDYLENRHEECKKWNVGTNEMMGLIDDLKVLRQQNELDILYEKMNELNTLMENALGEYSYNVLQDCYNEVNRYGNIPLVGVLDTLSQAEFALSQGEFFSSVRLALEAGPMLEEEVEIYNSLKRRIDSHSTKIFQIRNLGLDVQQGEHYLAKADSALQLSDYNMAREHLQQVENELRSVEGEVSHRQQMGMKSLEQMVQNGIYALHQEIGIAKERGVDTTDAENLIEKIGELMVEARTIEDYEKAHRYLSPAHSALNRARSRFDKTQNQEDRVLKELEDMEKRKDKYLEHYQIPDNILEYLRSAKEKYGEKEYLEVSRNIGRVDQFLNNLDSEEVDVEVEVEILSRQVAEEEWLKTKLTVKNLGYSNLKNISLTLMEIKGVKDLRKIRMLKGHETSTLNAMIKFRDPGINKVRVKIRGRKVADDNIFRLVEKINVFVGQKEDFFEIDGISGKTVDWA